MFKSTKNKLAVAKTHQLLLRPLQCLQLLSGKSVKKNKLRVSLPANAATASLERNLSRLAAFETTR